MSEKLNCWEVKKCGKQDKCPAYPDNGRVCWSVTGTFCGGSTQLDWMVKKPNCLVCVFYPMMDTGYDSA